MTAPSTVLGIAPYIGIFGKTELSHLLRRTLFGVRLSDVDLFAQKTLSEVVDALLSPSAYSLQPAPPLKNYADSDNPDPEVLAGQTWVYTQDNSIANGRRKTSFKAWWTGLMLQQEPNILEKMVLFWHNHFPIDMDDRSAIMAYIYNRTLRDNALGNFKVFVKAITLDPAMLRYLNGASNNVAAPDENFARELQELFTIGKGENAHFTESDVRAAARVLSGYQIGVQAAGFPFQAIFNPARHDTGDKQFSGFYNNTLIKGRTGADGTKELDDLLAMLFRQPEVAMFICRKIYRFFVYHQIDASVEVSIITPLAAIFRESNYEVLPVLKALFTSAHFFEVAFRGCIIKSPLDLVVGLGRSFQVALPTMQLNDLASIRRTYSAWYAFHAPDTNGAAAQRQNLADPPNVAGWGAYYQAPNYYRLWIDTETYPKRIKFIQNLLATNTIGGVGINVIDFTKRLSNPQKVGLLVQETMEILYSVIVSPSFQTRLIDILLSGQTNESYWTAAWNEYTTNPTATNRAVVETRLLAFHRAILLRPEFNLM
jgi:uncharacterized protein (DUF1800 family)